jgi:hypothetical protein
VVLSVPVPDQLEQKKTTKGRERQSREGAAQASGLGSRAVVGSLDDGLCQCMPMPIILVTMARRT